MTKFDLTMLMHRHNTTELFFRNISRSSIHVIKSNGLGVEL
jgi:hypothetical protein